MLFPDKGLRGLLGQDRDKKGTGLISILFLQKKSSSFVCVESNEPQIPRRLCPAARQASELYLAAPRRRPRSPSLLQSTALLRRVFQQVPAPTPQLPRSLQRAGPTAREGPAGDEPTAQHRTRPGGARPRGPTAVRGRLTTWDAPPPQISSPPRSDCGRPGAPPARPRPARPESQPRCGNAGARRPSGRDPGRPRSRDRYSLPDRLQPLRPAPLPSPPTLVSQQRKRARSPLNSSSRTKSGSRAQSRSRGGRLSAMSRGAEGPAAAPRSL